MSFSFGGVALSNSPALLIMFIIFSHLVSFSFGAAPLSHCPTLLIMFMMYPIQCPFFWRYPTVQHSHSTYKYIIYSHPISFSFGGVPLSHSPTLLIMFIICSHPVSFSFGADPTVSLSHYTYNVYDVSHPMAFHLEVSHCPTVPLYL